MMEVNTWAEGIENWLGLLKLAGTTTLACRIIINCTTAESVLELGSMSQCLKSYKARDNYVQALYFVYGPC